MQDIIDISGQPQLSATEYAEKHGVSRRTVSRYIQQGKLESVRRKGRTYVTDLEPTETPIRTESAKKLDNQDTQLGQLTRTPDDYMFKLGQLTVQAKSGHRWKSLSIVLVVLVFIAAPAITLLYITWQNTAAKLSTSQAAATAITADLATATTINDKMQKDLFQAKTTIAESSASIRANEVITQTHLDQLQDLRDQLKLERDRSSKQASLLARIQENEALIEKLSAPKVTYPPIIGPSNARYTAEDPR